MENKIYGEYIFYEDGKEIARSKNILTKFGKRYITQFLAGQSNTSSKDIALGIGSTPATVNDTQLNFEFYRSEVNITSVDIQTSTSTGLTTYGVVYKTTIPVDVSGIINEIGLFPSITLGTTDFGSRSISSFEDNQSWLDSEGNYPALVTVSSPKIGPYYMSVVAASSQSKNYFYDFNLDISGYSANDSMTMAYYQSDLNLDYVFLRAYDSNNNYYEIRYPGETALQFTGASPIGYKVKSLNLSSLYSSGFTSGTPNKNSIVKISVGAKAKSSGATTVLLDGLRINDEDTFRVDYGMISRSVLSPSNLITKSLGKQMDIEYRLGLSF
jgi:hypothetical protein